MSGCVNTQYLSSWSEHKAELQNTAARPCMEEWEQRLEITSHPINQKKWVRVQSTKLKNWVEYGSISSRGSLLDEPASQWEAHIYIHLHNLFVWCNHNIPELLIFTYSATPHLWASFPFFHEPGTRYLDIQHFYTLRSSAFHNIKQNIHTFIYRNNDFTSTIIIMVNGLTSRDLNMHRRY